MTLTVTFKPTTQSNLFFRAGGSVGLSFVDSVTTVGFSKVSLKNISLTTTVFTSDTCTLILNTEIANDSGLFSNTATIQVEVGPKVIESFTKIIANVDFDIEAGKVITITPKVVVDKETLLTAWINAGYPTKWENDSPLLKTEKTYKV